MKKRSIKLEINLTNKWFYTFISLGAILLLAIGVFAYNSGKSASVFGHSAGELEGVCKTNGDGCPDLGGGIESCRVISQLKNAGTMNLCCNSGEFLTGMNSPETLFESLFYIDESSSNQCVKFSKLDDARTSQIICCK